MPEYIYHAVDSKGQPIDGLMAAESMQQLDARIEELGYWLIDATEKKGRQVLREKPVSRRELVDFFNSLAVMLNAGMPLTAILSAIAEEATHAGFAAVLRDLRIQVEAGVSLDVAMQKHSAIFNTQIINLVKAGGYAGNLVESCQDISQHLEWLDNIISDVKQASLYPMMILLAVMGLVFIMFAYVVPRFSRVFDSMNMQLPWLTRVVVDIGHFTSNHAGLILSCAVLLVVFFRVMPGRWPALSNALDWLSLNLPVLGPLNRMIVQSRFCHNLALLLKSGVPILQALKLCCEVVDNHLMERAVQDAERFVQEGRKLTDALRRHEIVSPVVLRMLAVGEETGRLDTALEQVSKRFDTELPKRIKRVFGIIEPVIMIALITIVGLIGGAVFLPMFSLMSGVGG